MIAALWFLVGFLSCFVVVLLLCFGGTEVFSLGILFLRFLALFILTELMY